MSEETPFVVHLRQDAIESIQLAYRRIARSNLIAVSFVAFIFSLEIIGPFVFLMQYGFEVRQLSLLLLLLVPALIVMLHIIWYRRPLKIGLVAFTVAGSKIIFEEREVPFVFRVEERVEWPLSATRVEIAKAAILSPSSWNMIAFPFTRNPISLPFVEPGTMPERIIFINTEEARSRKRSYAIVALDVSLEEILAVIEGSSKAW